MNSERIKNAVCQHSDTEMNMLRENIREYGVIDPIVLCRGTIIDGYARYSIATALGIPFKTVEIDFADEAEAIIWRVKTHIGRRNLTAYQKCEMVLPLEAELRKEGKRRQGCINYCEPGWAYMSSNEQRWKNKLRKLARDYPTDCIIMKMPEDNGGFIYAKFPRRWVRVNPPRKVNLSHEQRRAVSDRLRQSRNKTGR